MPNVYAHVEDLVRSATLLAAIGTLGGSWFMRAVSIGEAGMPVRESSWGAEEGTSDRARRAQRWRLRLLFLSTACWVGGPLVELDPGRVAAALEWVVTDAF